MFTISFYPQELADTYALLELHRALEADGRFDLGFFEVPQDAKSRQLTEGFPVGTVGDLMVSAYTDVADRRGLDLTFQVDEMILKNCAIPNHPANKMALRQKYQVPLETPVAVIGLTDVGLDKPEVEDLAIALTDYAYVILYGRNIEHVLEVPPKIRVEEGYGALRDFFELADISFYGAYLTPKRDVMNNFVEASSGGTLFLVAREVKKFGFWDMVRTGLIRVQQSYELIKMDAISHLISIQDPQSHYEMRAQHLTCTREIYMPIIISHLEEMLSMGNHINHPDLRVRQAAYNGMTIRRIMHRQTQWRAEGDGIWTFPDGALVYTEL